MPAASEKGLLAALVASSSAEAGQAVKQGVRGANRAAEGRPRRLVQQGPLRRPGQAVGRGRRASGIRGAADSFR